MRIYLRGQPIFIVRRVLETVGEFAVLSFINVFIKDIVPVKTIVKDGNFQPLCCRWNYKVYSWCCLLKRSLIHTKQFLCSHNLIHIHFKREWFGYN